MAGSTQMDTDTESDIQNNIANDAVANEIIDNLILNKEAYFKSQQRDETEITLEEKRKIATDIFTRSKAKFLSRFGKQIKEEHLQYFTKFTTDEKEGYDLDFHIQNLKRYFSKTKRNMDIRNRRYGALNKLIQDNDYFSETEMMKRNPLLYDQLVGQYMSEDEKKKRDNIDTANITFVNVLLEGIDRDELRKRRKEQEKYEDDVMEEEEESTDEESEPKPKEKPTDYPEDEPPSLVKWGEFEGSEDRLRPNISWSNRRQDSPPREVVMITASERRLLKEEFTSIMYQNFIDGRDTEFDYASVDNNEEYDNIEIKNYDAEEKYFDSESPENAPVDTKMADDTSEDELEMFMERLNQHRAIKELANGMSHL